MLVDEIMQELIKIKEMISQKQNAPLRRWISMSEACEYAAKSTNWMRERLVSGKIYGFQETTKNGNEGNWTVDRNSIDAYFLGSDIKADVLDIKKRAGIY